MSIKIFIPIIILFSLFLVVSPKFSVVSSQESARSNTVCTRVGTVTGSPSPCDVGGISAGAPGSNDSLVKAGFDLYRAFVTCGGGETYPFSATLPCLVGTLRDGGYSAPALAAFSARYPGTIVGGAVNAKGPCVQCVGYVALSLALVHSAPSPLTDGGFAGAWYGRSAINFNGISYPRVSEPAPGDIGVKIAGVGAGEGLGGAGHILIVKEVLTGGAAFVALESNWGNPGCRVSDHFRHPTAGWVFFRRG